MEHDEDPQDLSEDYERSEDYTDEIDEFDYCHVCNGSGEGMYDGSSCYHCGGTGDEPVDKENDCDDYYE